MITGLMLKNGREKSKDIRYLYYNLLGDFDPY